ncbi:MAG: alanine racemase [Candidatus Falkowbacteria bacterium]|nr:alanine racemase [Candidatus Falkowbacteria bacterium]
MLNFLRQISKPQYETLNRLEIVADNIVNNYNYLQSLKPAALIFPVLKSNAYGHGLKELCQILNRTTAKMLVVDSFPEAQIVYKNFKGRVLILGEMPLTVYKYCNFRRTEFCVYNSGTVKYLANNYPGLKIHLFLNTGMNREGIKDIKSFYEENKIYLSKLNVNGLCSHLAAAEKKTESQENTFLRMVEYLKQQGISPKYIHLGNSLGFFTTKNTIANAFRIGLALYGYDADIKLKPALKLYSKVVAIQNVSPGETVSYGTDYVVQTKTKLAVIPFGYFEGLDRRLSSSAIEFLINGQPAKIAGPVCMNLTVLDIFNNSDIKVGDEVELIINNNQASNSVLNISGIMGTIPYEFLVKLNANIRRLIV